MKNRKLLSCILAISILAMAGCTDIENISNAEFTTTSGEPTKIADVQYNSPNTIATQIVSESTTPAVTTTTTFETTTTAETTTTQATTTTTATTTTVATTTTTETTTEAPPVIPLTNKAFKPTDNFVKKLGRTYYYNDALWLAMPASGIEFTVTGTRAEIELLGDNVSTASWGKKNLSRVAVFVDGVRVADTLMDSKTKTITAFECDTEITATIKIIKLSECINSTVAIKNVSVTSLGDIAPTTARPYKIEFIGDSITAGFGIDINNPYTEFTTASEDITKTYGYRTAQAFGADVSIVAFSGYGIMSGTVKHIPDYYYSHGKSLGKFDETLDLPTVGWDFSQYQPDLIVINAGQNDISYCTGNPQREAEFVSAYVKFLKQVRKVNPNATILCTLGIMSGSLYDEIELAVSRYTSETGDTNVYAMQFDKQLKSDGYAIAFHPTEATHIKAANALIAKIQQIKGW